MSRAELHQLIDKLPDNEILAAQRFLEYLYYRHSDPVYRAFMDAPVDDEPLADDEIAALAEVEAEIASGERLTWEQVAHHFRESA